MRWGLSTNNDKQGSEVFLKNIFYYLHSVKERQFSHALAHIPIRWRFLTPNQQWMAMRLGLYETVANKPFAITKKQAHSQLIARAKTHKTNRDTIELKIVDYFYNKSYISYQKEFVKELIVIYPEIIYKCLSQHQKSLDDDYYLGVYLVLSSSIMSLCEYSVFCEKYKIDANQLLLLEIILIAQEGDDAELVQLYFQSEAKGSLLEQLIRLQEVGVILKSYKLPKKGERLDLFSIPINRNLVKDFYKCSFELGKELFEEYPQFGFINGNPVGIRSVSKKFDSLEDFYRFYGKTIRWKQETHDHIIELVKWARENNILCVSLCNFVIDHRWDELEALRNGDLANTNFDAIKVV